MGESCGQHGPPLAAGWEQAQIETTTMLVDGYLDGWLPDGPITLG